MLATQDLQLSAVAQRLRQVLHQNDLLQLEAAQLAAQFAATNEYDEQGYATPIDWIRFNCHVTSNVAADLVAVGKNLERLPESIQAVSNGEIGFAHVKAMARTANAVKTRFEEGMLLEKARESSPGKFYYLCNHYRHAADRKGFEAEQAEQVENRMLWVSKSDDGSVQLTGFFDPAGGGAILTKLERMARKSGADDNRTREKRLGDAVVELASGGGSQAQIQVTSSIETLLGLAGAPAADMDFSLPISSTTVERLACDSSIARVLLDSESLVIDVGRSKRVLTEPSRRALTARDGHCLWPKGCDRPASRCAAHHLVHWIRGGPTDLDNLVLLCHRHHWMVHEGSWQLIRGDGGEILAIPPTVRFGPPSRGPD
jgi:hypothetical protein